MWMIRYDQWVHASLDVRISMVLGGRWGLLYQWYLEEEQGTGERPGGFAGAPSTAVAGGSTRKLIAYIA